MTDDAPKVATADVVQAAAHLRKLLHGLELRIAPTLSNRAIEEAARKLGAWKNGGAVVDHKEDFGLVLDWAAHHYRALGKSAVERFEASHGAELAPDEHAVLRALAQSRYTLVELRGGRGPASVDALDLIYEEPLLLVDPTLVDDKPGRVFAARVVPLGRFAMTTTAVAPIDVKRAPEMAMAVRDSAAHLASRSLAKVTAAERGKLEAQLMVWAMATPGPR
jgi:hypothetical protein